MFYRVIDILFYFWFQEGFIKRVTIQLKLFFATIDGTIYSWSLAIFLFWFAHKALVELLFVFSTDTIFKGRLSPMNCIFLKRFAHIITQSSIIEGFVYLYFRRRSYSLWIRINTCKNSRSLIMASILFIWIFMNIFFPWFFPRFLARLFLSTFG